MVISIGYSIYYQCYEILIIIYKYNLIYLIQEWHKHNKLADEKWKYISSSVNS